MATRDNSGAQLLRRQGLTQAEIADAIGTSHVAVGKWLRGQSRPNAAKRQQLFGLYAIPIASWDEPVASASSVAPVVSIAASSAVPETALGMAAELRAVCHQLFADVRASSNARERATITKSLASVIAQLAKVTGEYGGAQTFYGTPLWHRFVQAVRTGLRDHPEAARAVEAEFRRLDEEVTRDGVRDVDDDVA